MIEHWDARVTVNIVNVNEMIRRKSFKRNRVKFWPNFYAEI